MGGVMWKIIIGVVVVIVVAIVSLILVVRHLTKEVEA